MSVRRCVYCERVYVQWLTCRDGRRRLFNATLVSLDQLPDDQTGWIPGKSTLNGRARVVMAPITQVSRGKAEAAQRVAVQHTCPEYQNLHAAVFDS